MARINDNTVVQLIGNDRIVIVEDSTQKEHVIPLSDVPRLIEMLEYLHEAARKDDAGEAEPVQVITFDSADQFSDFLQRMGKAQ